jgi:hypothetical protein
MALRGTPTKAQWGWWHGKLFQRAWSMSDWATEPGGPGGMPAQR